MTGTVSAPDTDGESPAIFPKTIALAGRHKASVLRESLIGFKLAIIDRYAAVLPSDEAMLLGGITFGAKQNFKADLKNAMATSGTTHLVAISGYNITIVILAAESLLGRWFGRRTKFFATTTLIVLFIAMTGLQSSAIRAAIMGFLALAAKQSGRVFNLSHAIVLTAAIMVIIQPTVLAHDVGFELSFLSLLGIVCLCDPLKKLFRLETGGVMDWKDSAVTTLAAQLGTMPVLIAVFNQFSATAILPNVLILGTVPLTMLLGFMLAVVECVSAYLGFFIGKLTGLLLAYQLGVIQFFAAFALPLPIAFNSAVIFIFYYGALAWFALSYRGESSTTQKA
jgi:competence protein ComEC